MRHHQAQTAQVAADGHHATADVFHGGGRRFTDRLGRRCCRRRRRGHDRCFQCAREPTDDGAETGQVGQVCRR